jgi:hypothetical protein
LCQYRLKQSRHVRMRNGVVNLHSTEWSLFQHTLDYWFVLQTQEQLLFFNGWFSPWFRFRSWSRHDGSKHRCVRSAASAWHGHFLQKKGVLTAFTNRIRYLEVMAPFPDYLYVLGALILLSSILPEAIRVMPIILKLTLEQVHM